VTPEDRAKLDEIQAIIKQRGKGCGDCSACCTIMGVEMEPIADAFKPERQRCGYERKCGGCSIYENKPDSCESFMCLWLASQCFDGGMPDKWRPDRVGAVLDLNPLGIMTAHLKHETAFERQGPLRDMLLWLSNVRNPLFSKNFIILDRPSGNNLLFRHDGITEELVPCGIGPTGLKLFRTKYPGEV